jgi:kynurenine formamidase
MLYDLTMPLSEKTPVFPGDPPFIMKECNGSASDGGIIRHLTLSILTHTGTHIDAPFHMLKEGKTLDDFPLETFTGEALIIDVRGQKILKPNLAHVREGDAVFLCTDFSKNPEREDYFTHYPVLDVEEANKLVAKKVRMLGLDSPSPDRDPYETHRVLLSNNILILENLVHLAPLCTKRVRYSALPLKVKKADGAPCRVIAELL